MSIVKRAPLKFNENGNIDFSKPLPQNKPKMNALEFAEQFMRSCIKITKYNLGGITNHYAWLAKDLKANGEKQVYVFDIRETITYVSSDLSDITQAYPQLKTNPPEKIWFDTTLNMWVIESHCYG